MIEIFRDTKYDFLGKKWICIGLSVAVILLGAASIAWRALDGNPNTHPFNMGVDFTGGTLVNAKFRQKPDPGLIRAALEKQGIAGTKVTIQPVGEEIGQPTKNEVLIRLPNLTESEKREAQSAAAGQATTDTDIGGKKIRAALASLNDPALGQNKIDINVVSRDDLREKLLQLDPLGLLSSGRQSAETRYGEIAARIINYREKDRSGLIGSLDEIKNLSGIEPQLGVALDQHFYAGIAAIKSTDEVSPQIGDELRNRAIYATLFACLGMLLFVAFRFKSWGFGIGGVTAVFHDVLITLGLFSIMQWEINLTVIAALLTLVGFQMNDTIVIFDRIREIMRTKRREGLVKITNDAINETMSRTVITNGLAFLTVLALVLFGGDVLKSFSWALFIGVVVGTYSTIYIASPVMLWWEAWRGRVRESTVGAPVSAGTSASSETSKVGSSGVTPQMLASAGVSNARRKSRKKGR
ncbi:MAG: protein translocase subunit SecF [Acidobacteria bacterium]|nr:protein translocase subunit SecF [Acidobacteriota bacterium]